MLFRKWAICALSSYVPANGKVPAFLEMAKKGQLNEVTNAAKTTLLHLSRPQAQRYSTVCPIFTKQSYPKAVRSNPMGESWMRLAR